MTEGRHDTAECESGLSPSRKHDLEAPYSQPLLSIRQNRSLPRVHRTYALGRFPLRCAPGVSWMITRICDFTTNSRRWAHAFRLADALVF